MGQPLTPEAFNDATAALMRAKADAERAEILRLLREILAAIDDNERGQNLHVRPAQAPSDLRRAVVRAQEQADAAVRDLKAARAEERAYAERRVAQSRHRSTP